MHSLTIVFGPTGTAWRLLFKSKENAERAWKQLFPDVDQDIDNNFDIEDDFQQRARIYGDLHGAMLEDMDQSKLGAVELLLHNAHVQSAVQKRVQADPGLRAGIATPGMPMLSPMGGNGMVR